MIRGACAGGMEMVILIDMDDVIEQLLVKLVEHTNRKFRRDVTVDQVTDWNIIAAYPGMTKEQILDFMYQPGFWETVEPMPGAPEALKHFIDEGHEVFIVTATEYELVNEKMTHCLFRLFPFLSWDQVILTRRKQLIRGDVLIDDGIHNLEGGAYKRILFSAPYNREYDAEAHGMIRVSSWDEIVKIIDDLNDPIQKE